MSFLGWTPLKSPEPVRNRAEENVPAQMFPLGSLVSCSGSQMVDWNVNPSPLDGAVVGTRERWGWGGTRLYADVNKNSHFPTSLRIDRPFKTLRTAPRLDHARLLDWNNVFFVCFFFGDTPESGDNAGQTPLQVFKTIECCIFTCWVLRAYISVMSLFISFPESAVLQCHCPSCCPVSCLPLLTKRRRRGRTLVHVH